MPRLVLETSEPEQGVPLEGAPCVAGRLASCGLTLNEPQSSRKQFEVLLQGTRWHVRDMESRNGTFLNDERLSADPVPLSHGDRIRVGETIARYDAEAPALPEGLEMGNVILGAPQGRSEYGLLYSGRQPSLDRDVTVEVLDPDRAGDPRARERYQQRARSAGAFEHSAIVAVFDVAATERAVYTVFEAFPPQSLEERLRPGRLLSRADGLTVLRLIAEALYHVHTRDRVHGSLTPRAIRLQGEGKAKLCGLGEPSQNRLRLFRQDVDAFAAYASPEEARGEAPQPASDIYALGMVACHLLGGGLPGGGRKQDLLEHHASPDPVDLSGLALDGDLVAGLATLLDKSPDARPDAREAAGLFLELGGGGALSASSAIRRKRARAQGPARKGSAREPKLSASAQARASKGSARQAAKKGSARQAQQAINKGSARQAAKKGSARQAQAVKKGSARQSKQPAPAQDADGSRKPGSSARQAHPERGSSAKLAARRVSDRALAPEPPWALPARLALLAAGYGLMFAGAFLVARIATRVLG